MTRHGFNSFSLPSGAATDLTQPEVTAFTPARRRPGFMSSIRITRAYLGAMLGLYMYSLEPALSSRVL
jgi:hypothetical protein